MFTLKEIIEITAGNPFNLDKDLKVKGISTDSRKISAGELFVCLKGKNFNAADFIGDAKRKGAVAAIVEEGVAGINDFAIIKVRDSEKALADIAKANRLKFNIPVVAITGSNGKTTTKDMIAHIMGKGAKVLKTDENENNKIGVPLTLLKLKDHGLAVVEIGTNSFGEVKYNAEIIKATVGIITNIGESHLEGLKDKKGVLKEKISLIESLNKGSLWIKNIDDEMLAAEVFEGIRAITYGVKDESADFRAEDIRRSGTKTEFVVKAADGRRYNYSIRLLGIHNVYNALAAIAACSLFMDLRSIQDALADFDSPHMRMQIIKSGTFTIIDDTYNSNPFSFRHALAVLKKFPARGRKIVVCADMLELGKDSERLHLECGRLIADNRIDFLFTYGEKAVDIAKGALDCGMASDKVKSFADKAVIVSRLAGIAEDGDVILIKGSRSMKMEDVVKGVLYTNVGVKLTERL